MSEHAPTETCAGFLDGPTLRDALPSLSLVVLAGAGEIAVLAAAAGGEMLRWELGCIHALVVICLSAWSFARWRRGHDIRLSALGVLGVATCGPMGAAGSCLAFVLHAARHGSISPTQHASPTSVPAGTQPDADALIRRILATPHQAPRGSVASFNDVMALGTVEEKRAAISLMVARFRPEFTPALKRGLRDADAAVRVQAATGVSRLENLFQRRVRELENAAQSGGSEERLQLGNYLDEVSETGLLDESRTVGWRERALELYQGVAAERLEEVALRVGRALVRLGREREACDWFDRLPASIPMTVQLLLWRLEAAYRARRYTELRALCEQHRVLLSGGSVAPAPVLAAVTLWGECA